MGNLVRAYLDEKTAAAIIAAEMDSHGLSPEDWVHPTCRCGWVFEADAWTGHLADVGARALFRVLAGMDGSGALGTGDR